MYAGICTYPRLSCGYHWKQWHSLLALRFEGHTFHRGLFTKKHTTTLPCQRHWSVNVMPRFSSLFIYGIISCVVGYMVGSKAEKGGIAKDGAKMVRAVACADVPKLTVIVGGSFGAGNYGKSYLIIGPSLLITWLYQECVVER